MDKENGILYNLKKEEILPFTETWLYVVGIMLSDIRHKQKFKYCMISLIRGIFKSQDYRNRRKMAYQRQGQEERVQNFSWTGGIHFNHKLYLYMATVNPNIYF